VNNDISGPDGVVTHGRWLYAGDGDSTLKVFDLDGPTRSRSRPSTPAGTTAVDEMALTADGELLLAINNAEDPPFGTLFAANGDRNHSAVVTLTKITIDPVAFPGTPGIEQPVWDPKTKRFYVSYPILGKPGGCGTGDLRRRADGDRSQPTSRGRPWCSVPSIRKRTRASCRSATADPTAPRSGRMTTCC
jgi:hypothetical protein